MKILKLIGKILAIVAVGFFITAVCNVCGIVSDSIIFLSFTIFILLSLSLIYHYIKRAIEFYSNATKVKEILKCILLIFMLFIILNIILILHDGYQGNIFVWFNDIQSGFVSKFKEIFVWMGI